ncbi:uncharacterized protein LOC130791240, partial [Actinidia eriantha]|uniref:uncharacterized protein LOC130791240 n=1 Tax=Actinidia eriantha TaxID=165200 RepID=UPI0025826B69
MGTSALLRFIDCWRRVVHLIRSCQAKTMSLSDPPKDLKAIDVGHSPPSIVDWAIPLIRRGKLLGVYDPRIELPRDPLVRKQLAVIAAKCVRSCRERRPSMKEVVESLSALSKLVPLHSWNGFSNPCLMVEAVGRPVESRNTHVSTRANGVEGVLGGGDMKFAKPLRNSCRVYSDLGVRNNLMDLLAGTEWESEFRGEADGVEPKLISSNGGSSLDLEAEDLLAEGVAMIMRAYFGRGQIGQLRGIQPDVLEKITGSLEL